MEMLNNRFYRFNKRSSYLRKTDHLLRGIGINKLNKINWVDLGVDEDGIEVSIPVGMTQYMYVQDTKTQPNMFNFNGDKSEY